MQVNHRSDAGYFTLNILRVFSSTENKLIITVKFILQFGLENKRRDTQQVMKVNHRSDASYVTLNILRVFSSRDNELTITVKFILQFQTLKKASRYTASDESQSSVRSTRSTLHMHVCLIFQVYELLPNVCS